MALPEFLNAPELYIPIVLLVAAGMIVQRYLKWDVYVRIHRLKVRVVKHLGPPYLHHKGNFRGNAEYLTTRNRPVRYVWDRLTAKGGTPRGLRTGVGSPHLINSVKSRTRPNGTTEYSDAHVVWVHDDGNQTEAFMFQNPDGSTDVYSHFEAVTTDVDDHLNGEQTNGDPRGVVRAALGE